MRHLVVLVLACIAVASAANKWRHLEAHEKHKYTFEDFKLEFSRVYKDEAEEAFRHNIFDQSRAKVHKHNQDKSKSWRLGINKFSDMTEAEKKTFRGLHGGLLHKQKLSSKRAQPFELFQDINISDFVGVNVDWRTKGIITTPKDQGGCGSCWTFGTAETIESYYALKYNNLITLSEQQILDCTPNPNDCGGTGGCGGGTVELATDRIIVMGGLSLESSYPYKSGGGANFKCDMTKFKPVARVDSYTVLPSNQLAPVLAQVANNGPLAISVDASSWSDYDSGVFDGCDNTSPDIDHAVQLVGFGTDPSHGDYWLVRNSWGTGYGESGYIRLKRYATPPCGQDKTPSDGDGCNNGPPSVTVCGNCGILFDNVYPTMK